MASNYLGITVLMEVTPGQQFPVAGVDVAVRVHGDMSDVAESPLTTDSNGEIAAGSLAAVSVGARVHFRVENVSGLAGNITQITT
jgi:hypothetical protein